MDRQASRKRIFMCVREYYGRTHHKKREYSYEYSCEYSYEYSFFCLLVDTLKWLNILAHRYSCSITGLVFNEIFMDE